MGASWLVVRGILREDRRGWIQTLAVSVLVFLASSGSLALLQGIQAESEEVAATFFAGEQRLTHARGGFAAPAFNDSVEELMVALGNEGITGHAHVESQVLISKRGLLESYFQEEDQFTFDQADQSGDFRLGFLVAYNLTTDSALRSDLQDRLLAGDLPSADSNQVLVSLAVYQRLLGVPDWTPDRIEAQGFPEVRFEVTAGKTGVEFGYKSVIRETVAVSGILDAGAELLNDLIVVAPMELGWTLLDTEQGRLVNAIRLSEPASMAALQAAHPAFAEVRTESAGDFADRYLGDVLRIIEGILIAFILLVFLLPTLLVQSTLQARMQRQERPLGVLRAIGVPATYNGRLIRSLAGVLLLATIVVALLLAPLLLLGNPVLAGVESPVPLALRLTLGSLLLPILPALAAHALAAEFTVRRFGRSVLPSLLQSAD